MTGKANILTGDALTVLRTLPDESVQCCVTSPPYWRLRDYGTATWEGGSEGCGHAAPATGGKTGSTLDGAKQRGTYSADGQFRDVCGHCGAVRIDQQLGLESTPDEYVARLVEVFREVRRVLRNDGTIWLNLGDSYATNGAHGGRDDNQAGVGARRTHLAGAGDQLPRRAPTGLKPKDLVGIPWMMAFALRADGWYLRSEIIWAKPNPMPESVRDRVTKAHEQVFLLSKSERYYYDADAIAEPATSAGEVQWAGTSSGMNAAESHVGSGESTRRFGKSGNKERKLGDERGRPDSHLGGSIPWEGMTRNARSVWTIVTKPFNEAHFATMPVELAQRCIKAGSSNRACEQCGAPWGRVTERESIIGERPMTTGAAKREALGGMARTTPQGRICGSVNVATLGWQPTCECADNQGAGRCVVLDPFGGAGTTGLAAVGLARDAVLIELNPAFVDMADNRINDTPLFSS